MANRISLPLIDSELGWQFKHGGDSDFYYHVRKWRLGLFDQSIHYDWCVRTGVNGVYSGIQIFDLLGGGFLPMSGHLVSLIRRPSFPFNLLALKIGSPTW